MPIKLITGLPGSGKSLSLIEECYKLKNAKQGDDAPIRPVFIWGIDGVSPELGVPLRAPDARDLTEWDQSLIENWRDLPDGSIVVIDEVWKVWGQCMAGKEPDHVKALAEHRHRGFDFVVATQHPSQICSFARNMIQQHIHIRRKFGTQVTEKTAWESVVMDLQSEGKRDLGITTVWKFPKELFKFYKSATVHTVKRRIPPKFFVLAAVLLILPVLAYFGWGVFGKLMHLHPPVTAASATDGKPVSLSQQSLAHPQSAEAWEARQTPRVAGIPWSAPMWDGLHVQGTPDLYCIISEREGGTHVCNCYNEQVIPVRVHDQVCQVVARHGVYNPYRPPMGQGASGAGERDASAAPPSASVAQANPVTQGGLSSSAAPQTGVPQSYTPPGYSSL